MRLVGPARTDMKHRIGNAVVFGSAIFVALAAVQRYTHALPGSSKEFKLQRERCYGIARAGKNDCGTSVHACAGQALADLDRTEWLSLPAGTCDKIIGGKVKTTSL